MIVKLTPETQIVINFNLSKSRQFHFLSFWTNWLLEQWWQLSHGYGFLL